MSKNYINLQEKNEEILSSQILLSKDPTMNYYAILNLSVNKIKHLQIIIDSRNPSLNFACLKHCIKSKKLTSEEKRELAKQHAKIVMQSNDQKLIEELNRFLKYNSVDKEYKPIRRNSGRKTKHRK